MADPTPINKSKMASWPGVAKVAKLLSRSIKQVNQMVTDGDLTAHTLANGERRFDPVQVNALVDELQEVPADDENDLGALTVKAKSESIVLHAMLEYTRELRTQNRDQHTATVDLLRQNSSFFKTAQESKDQTIEFLKGRVQELEQTQISFLQAREQLLDAREDRDLVRSRAKQRQDITPVIWQTTKRNFGELVEAAKKKWGVDDKTAAKLNAARELLESVAATPTRLEVLIETGLVTDEEAVLIRKILDLPDPPPKAQTTDDAAPASPGDGPAADAAGDTDAKDQTEPKSVIDVDPEPAADSAEPTTTADDGPNNGDQSS